MPKRSLKDVTFLIPVRIDSIDRLENLSLSVEFLLKSFDTNILILEAAPYNSELLVKVLPANVEVIYLEDKKEIFHRTYYINRLVKEIDTPYVAAWDSDIIVPACFGDNGHAFRI